MEATTEATDTRQGVPIAIRARDGYPLGATLWQPVMPPSALVLIHPATGVRARFYARFAAMLAANGFVALTYDYRGIGLSRPSRLRGFDARVRDWADLDVEGVNDWAVSALPDLPLLAIGHSFGGHAIGLCETSRHLRGGVLICSNVAWLGFIAGRFERWKVSFLFNSVGPLLVQAFGYAPSKRLGLFEDLPGPALLEWRSWCNFPRYFFDDPSMHAALRFERVQAPLLVVGADDDPWATPPSVDLLSTYFVNAPRERWQIPPSEAGGRRIGHVGFFRQEHQDTLWPALVRRLRAMAGERAEEPGTVSLARDAMPMTRRFDLGSQIGGGGGVGEDS